MAESVGFLDAVFSAKRYLEEHGDAVTSESVQRPSAGYAESSSINSMGRSA
jgi:hypothetical protein